MFDSLTIFQSSLSLGLAGILGYALKDIPSYLFNLFMQKYTVAIEVNSESYITFNATASWLVEYFPELSNDILLDGYDTLNVNISNGVYYFLPSKFTIVIIYKRRLEHQQNEIKHNILITILGLNRFKILTHYQEYLHKMIPDLKYNTPILVRTLGRCDDHLIYKKSFDDVYFDGKEKLINLLDNFKKYDNIYEKHGLSKSIGILLYGPPGTGKTTIAKAIAAYLDWPIRFIQRGMESLPTASKCVILFEDIDTLISTNREDTETLKQDKYNDISLSKISLHDALNYLDGCLTPNNTIIVATTNYLDRLDSALIRDGRFDYKFKIDYMTKEKAMQMCDRFNVSYSLLDDIKFPISPAVIQNKILNKFLQKK